MKIVFGDFFKKKLKKNNYKNAVSVFTINWCTNAINRFERSPISFQCSFIALKRTALSLFCFTSSIYMYANDLTIIRTLLFFFVYFR